MSEKPILFSGPMVRAILDGRKTQTRRVVKPQPKYDTSGFQDFGDGTFYDLSHGGYDIQDKANRFICPYGKTGDRLWVRERHQLLGHWRKNGISHKAGSEKWSQKWTFVTHPSRIVLFDGQFKTSPKRRTELGYWTRPSIFMPRWASRITLEITSVRVERVQEIKEVDAIAEGIVAGDCWNPISGRKGDRIPKDPIWAFRKLWDSLNKVRAPWAETPWVWVIEFKGV